jgi:RNA recognition motif-containing protein
MARVYFGNLPYSMTREILSDLLEPYDASEILICRAPDGQSKGYGFATLVDAERAISELNGSDFNGRQLRVAPAQPRGSAARS